MSDNVAKLPERNAPILAEWDVKMRMVMGGFEFDLPDMSMTPNYIDKIVTDFRLAVEKAIAKGQP